MREVVWHVPVSEVSSVNASTRGLPALDGGLGLVLLEGSSADDLGVALNRVGVSGLLVILRTSHGLGGIGDTDKSEGGSNQEKDALERRVGRGRGHCG